MERGTQLRALIIQLKTDEGIIRLGECVGPTLPTIETIVEKEMKQFLIGQNPMRTEWLVHRMEEFARNWSQIGAYAISGVEMALLRESMQVLYSAFHAGHPC